MFRRGKGDRAIELTQMSTILWRKANAKPEDLVRVTYNSLLKKFELTPANQIWSALFDKAAEAEDFLRKCYTIIDSRRRKAR